jgi:hypothetical protein
MHREPNKCYHNSGSTETLQMQTVYFSIQVDTRDIYLQNLQELVHLETLTNVLGHVKCSLEWKPYK